MNIVIVTREYPPHTYGGAGVHVEYLTRELARAENHAHTIHVLCFGDQQQTHDNLIVRGIEPDFVPPFQDARHKAFMQTLLTDVVIAGSVKQADIVHGHTWYSHLAGCLLRQLTGSPLVLTTHSLEPHRPWKVEQLGTAYHGSSWIEKTAYENCDGVIAVSKSMKDDVQQLYGVSQDKVRVIHNGIDVQQYRHKPNPAVLAAYDIDPDQPFVLFVGRITRQKGIIHLVNAIKHIRPGVQVVLCAGAPDTEDIANEMTQKVEQARAESDNHIIWIQKILPKDEVIALYSQASVFVCPSVYEPFGIINLEAMACETPVVASSVGGIPEIVVPDATGLLVPFETRGSTNFEPKNPERFSRDLAEAVNQILSSPEKIRHMSKTARERVEKHFSWSSIAAQTLAFYRELIERKKAGA